MIIKGKEPRYIPYVSKSDRPKGRAKELKAKLKAMGMKGNLWAMQQANELLSPTQVPVPVQKTIRRNQKKERKQRRSNPNA